MVAYKCESLASVLPIEDISGKQAKSLNPVSTYQYIYKVTYALHVHLLVSKNVAILRENTVRNHDG